jgi:DNA-directed RNA polymerase specialized sigma subunit|nr:MAG TPA: Protein of unknown function (DUF1492) [Caudoviricetes sp.]
MTPKEYMEEAYLVDQIIDAKLEQVQSLKELSTKATSTISDMPRSATPNLKQMETVICKLVDLQREINCDIDRLVDLKRERMQVIKYLDRPEQRVVLELRYLNFKKWSVIASITGFSIRQLYRIHDEALNSLKKIKHVTLLL